MLSEQFTPLPSVVDDDASDDGSVGQEMHDNSICEVCSLRHQIFMQKDHFFTLLLSFFFLLCASHWGEVGSFLQFHGINGKVSLSSCSESSRKHSLCQIKDDVALKYLNLNVINFVIL